MIARTFSMTPSMVIADPGSINTDWSPASMR